MKALGLDVRDEPPINVRPTPALRPQPREIKVTPIRVAKKPTIIPHGLRVEPAVTVGDPTTAPGPNRLIKQKLYKGAKERAAQRLYKQARQKFVIQKYKPASKLLKHFLKRYFDHDLADNALYWLGETAYVQSNWLQSLSWFQDVIIRYPEGNKLAGAMLKSALCYAQMGDKAYAVKVLTDVETLFPQEHVAQIARTRRLALSGGGQ
jgi:tol-pal system protein YbgF